MQAIILAAGESSRFSPLNGKHKALFRLMGKSLIEWTVGSVIEGGIKDIIIVEGGGRDIHPSIKKPRGARIHFATQQKPLGMANALQHCRKHIKDRFFLLHPYHFYAAELISLLKSVKGADAVLLGKKTARPRDYGIMRLSGNKVEEIIEKPKVKAGNTRVVGAYLLGADIFDYIGRVRESMYSFEEALSLYCAENTVKAAVTKREIPSVKYPWDMLAAARLLLKAKARKTPMRDDIATGHNVVIEGKVFIGRNVRIYENAVIRGPAYIGDNCIIGNNALVRESILEEDVTIGANSEVARSVFSKGCRAHSGYFGDSVFGEGCRIGAGFISANVRLDRRDVNAIVKGEKVRTGLKSLGAICGGRVMFGVGARTMPGVMIGSGAVIGPGVIVRENVQEKTKVI